MRPGGLIIAAPASGSGKTVITLGLMRALTRRGLRVAAAKTGPDYIDPAFHAVACGRPSLSLDGWAMRPQTVSRQIRRLEQDADIILCEGVMGLFDGANLGDDAPPGSRDGSTADLAALTGWPVLLLAPVKGQAGSVAAVLRGFTSLRPELRFAGLLCNRVGSPVHRAMIDRACARACPDIPRLGWIPVSADLALPERHLGLVQAAETAGLDQQLDAIAAVIAAHTDLDALVAAARPACDLAESPAPTAAVACDAAPVPLLGARIAIARDAACAFAYPGLLASWQDAGAELHLFSPLADEAPPACCDAVYLPGGYPELHAGRLAANSLFLNGLRDRAAAGAVLYGECGGYMLLGEALEDAAGITHPMAGLLPVVTSFARRRLHLGYRQAQLCAAGPLGDAGSHWRGHEFHYSSVLTQDQSSPLFRLRDAAGRDLGVAGQQRGRVFGSYLHLLDRAGDV